MSHLELATILRRRAEELQQLGLRKLRQVLSRSKQVDLYDYLEMALNPGYTMGSRYPHRTPTPSPERPVAGTSQKRAASATVSRPPKAARRMETTPVGGGSGSAAAAEPASTSQTAPTLTPLPCPRGADHHHGMVGTEWPDRFTLDRAGGKLYSCPFRNPVTQELCLVGVKDPSTHKKNRETVINHIRSQHLGHIPQCTVCGLTVALVSSLNTHYGKAHPLEEDSPSE